MIEKLRRKFMIVTVSILLVTFTVFFIATYVNNNYWYAVDTVGTLEWLAESGVFTEGAYVDEGVDIDDENPIIGVITDSDGVIKKQHNIGGNKANAVTQETVDDILSQGSKHQRYRSYIYIIKALDHGDRLIVLQDISHKNGMGMRIIGSLALIVMGIAALFIIAFVLSKFITEPARRELEREKQFVSDASHELKTPISAIAVNCQALDSGSDNVNIRNILSETKRMNSLIEKLLTLSKLEETPLTEKAVCSFSDIAKEMILTYESVAFDKGIEYKYKVADDVSVTGDEEELKQLMAILIDNALKNTESSGEIDICLGRKGRRAVLEIRNTGQGISEEDLPHIFERFYTKSASRSDNSFGLGLSIAKSIVDRHKGSINVKTIPDNETVFTVVI